MQEIKAKDAFSKRILGAQKKLMAEIYEYTRKDGSTSFYIRASDGYCVNGKQRRPSKTWKPPKGMSIDKARKEAKKEAVRFEDSIKVEQTHDGSMKFERFCEDIWRPLYAPKKKKTLDGYNKLLPQIYQAIGHIPLNRIATVHLDIFYKNLQEAGMRRDTKYAPAIDVGKILERRGLLKKDLEESTGLSRQTIRSVIEGKNVNHNTAKKVSEALEVPMSKLFTAVIKNEGKLSALTVLEYHRVISSILGKAKKKKFISRNPAEDAELPSVEKNPPLCLEEEDITIFLEELPQEPEKYRNPIIVDILSGERRGEILGMRWNDVDFTNETVNVEETINYTSSDGMYKDSPKSKTSKRTIHLPSVAFDVLQEQLEWQNRQKEKLGDRWNNPSNYVFTNEYGQPIHPDTLTRRFSKLAKRLGYPGVHLHTLRHSYASLLVSKGIPLKVISELLGHTEVRTTEIYAHPSREALKSAVKEFDMFGATIRKIQDA